MGLDHVLAGDHGLHVGHLHFASVGGRLPQIGLRADENNRRLLVDFVLFVVFGDVGHKLRNLRSKGREAEPVKSNAPNRADTTTRRANTHPFLRHILQRD